MRPEGPDPKDYLTWTQAEGITASMAVPFLTGKRIEGLLYVEHRSARVFSDQDERNLSRLADHAVTAIQNARLFQETQRQLRDTETLLAVSQSIGPTLDVTETVRREARALGQALGADMAGTYLADPGGPELRPLAGYHVPRELLEAFMARSFPLHGHPFIEQARASRAPVFTSDAGADPRIDRPSFEQFPHRSLLFVPMFVVALEAVGRELTSSLDRGEVIARIVARARILCGADLAFLAPHDRETDTAPIVAAAGERSEALFAVARPETPTPAKPARRSRKPNGN